MSANEAVRGVLTQFEEIEKKAENERQEVRYIANVVSEEHREQVRAKLVEAAEVLRRNYGFEIPKIRNFLHEMLDVSV